MKQKRNPVMNNLGGAGGNTNNRDGSSDPYDN